MQIEFTERGRGWRTAGRPVRQIPPEIMDALNRTYEQGVQAEFPLYGATEAEVRHFVRLLEHGARQLGKRLRKQIDATMIRFYLEDKA
jgi:hypothetical protein